MKLRRLLLLAWTVLLAGLAVAAENDDLAARVIVLANSDDPDSVRLARAYAERRSIPAANIIALKMSRSETIAWPEFVATIHQPLQDELVRREWLDGIVMNLRDALGRRKIAMSGHRISYLVVCRGVPLRIAHDPALYAAVPPLTNRTEFRTNGSSVDGELSLLAQSGLPINAFVPNPLFRNEQPTELEEGHVVRVARLDGPTYEQALGLVDSALAAERTGLVGRAYVDLSGFHPDGDQWLELAAQHLREAGYDLDVQREGATLAATERADAAAFYFGWYAPQIDGPFALPGYRFAPGAVALHIHSFSAQSLQLENGGGWTGPLVARGVAGTFGNVGEPYLQLTHQPQLVLRALLRGATLGEAAYYALPALSWQGIVVGDPLYRPLRVPFARQWEERDRLPPALRPYVVVREVQRLEAARQPAAARELLRAEFAAAPGLPLALELAAREHAAGDAAAAIRTIEQGLPAAADVDEAAQWGLRALAARRLAAYGAPKAAVEMWKRLLISEAVPPAPRLAWLREAWRAATEAGDLEQATRWERVAESLGGTLGGP